LSWIKRKKAIIAEVGRDEQRQEFTQRALRAQSSPRRERTKPDGMREKKKRK
jgi:hypothetical protein